MTGQLWPLSRDALQKQFLPLVGECSTYQETFLRLQGPMFAPPIVIAGPDFHFFTRRQAEEVLGRAVHGTNRSTHRSSAFTASQIGVAFFWN
jgi:mannose-1-phosphate guanylyltransferase